MSRYPTVTRESVVGVYEELPQDTLNHFQDSRFAKFVMSSDIPDFDKFTHECRAMLETNGTDLLQVQLRTFTWCGYRLQVLSIPASQHAVASLMVITNHLHAIEMKVSLTITRGNKKIDFPFPAKSLTLLVRKKDQS